MGYKELGFPCKFLYLGVIRVLLGRMENKFEIFWIRCFLRVKVERIFGKCLTLVFVLSIGSFSYLFERKLLGLCYLKCDSLSWKFSLFGVIKGLVLNVYHL